MNEIVKFDASNFFAKCNQIEIQSICELTSREKAIRAAGIIDCDGCISVSKSKTGQQLLLQYTVICGVQQVTKEIPIWLCENFGGTVSVYQPKSENRRMMYNWKVSSKQAEKFLSQIEPFLLIKQKQTRLALELRKFQGRNMRRFCQQDKEKVWERIYHQIKVLNGSIK